MASAPQPDQPPHKQDVRSVSLALTGTFILRCASYAAGLLILVSLGIKSRSESNVTAELVSLVAVTFYASELIGAPIFGALSDRFGRKPFMMLGPIFGGIAAQLMSLTMLIPVLVLVRVLEGLSTASAAPSTLGFLSANTAGSEKFRGRVMGFYEAATVVGLALGAAVGGKLHDQYGQTSFTIVAGIYLLSLLPFLFVRDRPSEPRVKSTHHRNLLSRMLNRRIMRFAPAWLAANAVLGAWFSVGPFLAAGAPNESQFLMRGFSSGEIAMVYPVFGILFTLGAITWGFVMPVIGRQATLLIGVGGLGFVSVMLWMLNHAPYDAGLVVLPLVGLIMVGVFVQSGFTPAALSYLAEIAEERAEDRGAVMGVYSVLFSVGQLVGGALAGPFAERMGINGLIVLTGLFCLVALFTVILLGQSERRYARAQAAAAV